MEGAAAGHRVPARADWPSTPGQQPAITVNIQAGAAVVIGTGVDVGVCRWPRPTHVWNRPMNCSLPHVLPSEEAQQRSQTSQREEDNSPTVTKSQRWNSHHHSHHVLLYSIPLFFFFLFFFFFFFFFFPRGGGGGGGGGEGSAQFTFFCTLPSSLSRCHSSPP